MRKICMFISALVVLVMFSATESHAQNVTPTMSERQVADLVARVHKAPAGKFLLKEIRGPDDQDFRVVFIHNDKWYSVDYNLWVKGLYIWIRPDGASDARGADALGDENLDGIVDLGTDGHDKMFSVANSQQDGSEAKGLKHQPYWQDIYNEFLAGLEDILR